MKFLLVTYCFLFCSSLLPAQQKQINSGVPGKKALVISSNKTALRWYTAGNSYLASGDYGNATSCYSRAIRTDTLFITAMDSLGFCYRITGNSDSAILVYRQSFRIRPTNVYAMTNLAMVYIQKNDLVNAEDIYRRIIKTDARDPDGYFGLAEVLLKTKRFDRAIENALKAYQLWKVTNSTYAGDALFYAGLGYLSKGDNINARKYFEKAMKTGTKVPSEYLEKAGLK